MESTRIVERYLEEALCGDDDAVVVALVSSPELRQRTLHMRGAFPEIGIEIVALVAQGDRVAAHFVARGTHEGVFHGVPPTGREFEAACTAIFRVADGRIAEVWMTWDSLSLLEQLRAISRVDTVSA